MKCKECCGDGYNLRIIKKGNGYTTERVTCEHCNGTGEVQTTETKLKPCPFCGGEASMYIAYDDGYYVCCDECGCGLPVYNTEEEAIEAWNKRVGEVKS